MKPLNIIIADDHPLFREGLERALLRIQPDFQIFHASHGIKVLELLDSEVVDIIFMDIRMPDRDGIEITRSIRKFNTNVKIVAVSMIDDRVTVIKIVKAGANGFLHKNTDVGELEKAIETVMAGRFYVCHEIADYESEFQDKDYEVESNSQVLLSEREIEILQLICNQYSSKEIGLKLNLTEKTIETHRNRLILKTRSKNVVGLIIYAVEKGYILPDHRRKE
ncbi:MAG: response regulator transcription factor [Bacteroidetes bacterium]|nr:response regulator transcription factor [Bacteroidota bacterium]